MPGRIVSLDVTDVRFPTSRELDGSDAMNPDPDYSTAYVVLGTDDPGADGLRNLDGTPHGAAMALAEDAYALADAMMAERTEQQEETEK